MIIAKAHARYLRISPQKVRLVIDLIRGESVSRALLTLANSNKKARICIEKVVKSAISNARTNPQTKQSELFISKIVADQGPMFKRFRAAAMGRATMIRHRTTHISVELAAIKTAPVKAAQTKTIKKKPVKQIKQKGVKK